MAITTHSDGGQTFTGKGIEVYRLATLLMALKLQSKGIKMNGKSPAASTIAKKVYGLKGSVAKLIPQVEALLAKAKSETTFVQTVTEGTAAEMVETVGTVVETV